MAVISLLALVAAIALGVAFGKNIGIISLATAMILGFAGGVSSNDIIAGFSTNLFLNMTGMFFFFSIAQANGALELLSKKVFKKISGATKLYPIMVYLVCVGITIIDPGGLTVYTCMTLITMSIGAHMGYNPIMIGIITIYAANAGIMTPVGLFGNTANLIITNAGYSDNSISVFLNGIIMHTVGCILVYILYRGWRIKSNEGRTASIESIFEDIMPFNNNQKFTLIMLVFMILCIMLLKTHAGLTALVFSVILLLANCADEKEAFAGTPWETIFLCVGIGCLLNVSQILGGLTLMTDLFSSMSSRWTVAPILGFTSSVMSFFSLAIAGPIPTLISTVAQVNEGIGNVFQPIELISSIVNGGYTATISPLSMGGAMIMATYDQLFKPDVEEKNRVFRTLFSTAVIISIIAALLANTGIYKVFTNM
jgi:di/tricarboxylate transporter